MKTNNLERENKIKVKYPELWSMLKELYKITYDSATDESNADRPDYSYYYEKIETHILNREKAHLTDIKSKIDKEIERWEKVGTPETSYKISALYDLRKKL